MAAERDIHVILVSEIEKYPLLYNYKLPEYSRKDLTEKAWTEIAKKTRLTVNDCKEKWRNIRSTFLRSIKSLPSGSKSKKPYYLSEHLTFILPYVKPLNDSPNRGNIPSIPETERSPIDAEAVGQENEEQGPNVDPIDSQDFQQQPALPVQSTSSATAAPTSQIHGARRRKLPASEVDAAMIKFFKKKTEQKEDPTESQNGKQMNHFFLSLLPEFSDMTNQQIRTFKIKVLQLIDDIKHTNQSSSSGTNSRESYYSYSPISSVGTPASIGYETPFQDNSPHIPINFSARAENPVVTPSPVHLPYDSVNSSNNDNFLAEL